MKKNKLGTTIIESLVIMLITVSGIVGMFTIYDNSQKLIGSTSNRIQAIQIAREGLEAMINIRDTNWIMYSSDYTNCWNTLNYNDKCVGDSSPGTNKYDIKHNKSYIIYKIDNPADKYNNTWQLSEKPTSGYNSTYITNFKVYEDNNGFYTQSGSALIDVKPVFTREIKIKYLDSAGNPGNSNDNTMSITSKVQWIDNSKSTPHKVELSTVITNWKNRK